MNVTMRHRPAAVAGQGPDEQPQKPTKARPPSTGWRARRARSSARTAVGRPRSSRRCRRARIAQPSGVGV
jgi:hypothetical protein